MAFNWNDAMQMYDIRLTKTDYKTRSVYQIAQADDHAAIRRALRLAADEATVEVWRGMECVYASDDRVSKSIV
jgi:hypothetical protein